MRMCDFANILNYSILHAEQIGSSPMMFDESGKDIYDVYMNMIKILKCQKNTILASLSSLKDVTQKQK